MAVMYTRYVNGTKVSLGKYSESDYAIYIGCRLYAEIDNVGDAYRMYNEVTEEIVTYIC